MTAARQCALLIAHTGQRRRLWNGEASVFLGWRASDLLWCSWQAAMEVMKWAVEGALCIPHAHPLRAPRPMCCATATGCHLLTSSHQGARGACHGAGHPAARGHACIQSMALAANVSQTPFHHKRPVLLPNAEVGMQCKAKNTPRARASLARRHALDTCHMWPLHSLFDIPSPAWRMLPLAKEAFCA